MKILSSINRNYGMMIHCDTEITIFSLQILGINVKVSNRTTHLGQIKGTMFRIYRQKGKDRKDCKYFQEYVN